MESLYADKRQISHTNVPCYHNYNNGGELFRKWLITAIHAAAVWFALNEKKNEIHLSVGVHGVLRSVWVTEWMGTMKNWRMERNVWFFVFTHHFVNTKYYSYQWMHSYLWGISHIRYMMQCIIWIASYRYCIKQTIWTKRISAQIKWKANEIPPWLWLSNRWIITD